MNSNPTAFNKIANVLGKWNDLAHNKLPVNWHQIDNLSHGYQDLLAVSALTSSMGTCMRVAIERGGIPKADHFNSIFVSMDIELEKNTAVPWDEKIQAMGFIDDSNPKKYEITYLVTHPRNVRNLSENEEETARVEGAASAIIDHLSIAQFYQAGDGIWVITSETAKLFYTKNGFLALDPNEHPPRPGAGICWMVLDSKAILRRIGQMCGYL